MKLSLCILKLKSTYLYLPRHMLGKRFKRQYAAGCGSAWLWYTHILHIRTMPPHPAHVHTVLSSIVECQMVCLCWSPSLPLCSILYPSASFPFWYPCVPVLLHSSLIFSLVHHVSFIHPSADRHCDPLTAVVTDSPGNVRVTCPFEISFLLWFLVTRGIVQ